MAWEIRVWHENIGEERARMSIEAGEDVPDEVISTLASAYWLENVVASAEGWEDVEDFDPFEDEEGTGPQIQA